MGNIWSIFSKNMYSLEATNLSLAPSAQIRNNCVVEYRRFFDFTPATKLFIPTQQITKFIWAVKSGTETVDMGFIMDFYQFDSDYTKYASKALQFVALYGNRVTELNINYSERDIYLPGGPPKATAKMLAAISKITTLQKLTIDKFHFTISDVMKLCETLPKLIHLKVEIAPTPEGCPIINSVDRFKKHLNNLRVFNFSSLWSKESHKYQFQEILTILCVQHLPRLMQVGVSPQLFFADMALACMTMNPQTVSSLCMISIKMNLLTEHKISALHMFPDVSHLSIKWETYRYRSIVNWKLVTELLQFRHLNSLEMIDLSSLHYMNEFLCSYGNQLAVLSVLQNKKNTFTYQMKLLSEYCPNLEELSWSGQAICNLDDYGALAVDSFPRLKKLILNVETSKKFKLISLSNILLPQSLQNVSLLGIYATVNDLRRLKLLVERRACMEKLAELFVKIRVEHVNVTANIDQTKKLEAEIALFKDTCNNSQLEAKIDFEIYID